MKDCSKKENSMDKVYLHRQMEVHIQDNSNRENITVMDSSNGKMEMSIEDSITWGKDKVLVL